MPPKKPTRRTTTSRTRTTASTAKKESTFDKIDQKLDKFLKKEELLKAKDKTMEFLKEHPVATIALSAAVGAGVALIVSSFRGSGERPKQKSLREKIIELLE
jgi:ElaB/YqjD/DUF883 family membrane-anchored ribosome-binding protein